MKRAAMEQYLFDVQAGSAFGARRNVGLLHGELRSIARRFLLSSRFRSHRDILCELNSAVIRLHTSHTSQISGILLREDPCLRYTR
jgi:hypothetical protein